jgi:hypothetical protein
MTTKTYHHVRDTDNTEHFGAFLRDMAFAAFLLIGLYCLTVLAFGIFG